MATAAAIARERRQRFRPTLSSSRYIEGYSLSSASPRRIRSKTCLLASSVCSADGKGFFSHFAKFSSSRFIFTPNEEAGRAFANELSPETESQQQCLVTFPATLRFPLRCSRERIAVSE